MLAWMMYALTVSLLLTGAAACAAHCARQRGAPSRFIWAACIAASLLIPAAISSVSIELPQFDATAATSPPRTLALRDATPHLITPALFIDIPPAAKTIMPRLESALPRLWAALSLLLAAGLLASAVLLAWRKRSWGRATLAGTPVLVSENSGPALAGLLRPVIVVPKWLLSAGIQTQRHVIAHERAHLVAGDTHLLAASLAMLVLMPWNLPLWWQLQRLRLALETDCDARVIAAGHHAARYAETLIGIGEYRGRTLGAAISMAAPVSSLEKRIRLMMQDRDKQTRRSWLGALAAAALFATAAAVTPPNALADGPADLARFTGLYQMAPSAVLSVTETDGKLMVQLTGQSALPVTPCGPASFAADIVGAKFDFTLPESGPATAVTLHQHGAVIAMPRIDAAQAQRIESATATSIKRATPAPGSREALIHLVDGIVAGKPDYVPMTPQLAAVVRDQLATLHDGVGALGPIQSITFIRVGEQGQDVYLVKQKQGSTTWRIMMAGDKIIGVRVLPAP
jgi:beta-lactamase regulating signal transducer with metallopeptidase domain